ncbi:MAG: GlsB/YeaQ/YmgE family stress response membrane protein [Chloroflexi bacterium]|nr:GlsB/YeaQ/YmgE family stress response membrane protein [Chloroflexota bacterium]
MSIIAWLVVGALAGWIAGMIVKGDEGYGVIGAIIAGILGAILGGFLLGLVTGEDYMAEFSIMTVVAAIVGAVIVVLIWRAVAGRRSTV